MVVCSNNLIHLTRGIDEDGLSVFAVWRGSKGQTAEKVDLDSR